MIKKNKKKYLPLVLLIGGLLAMNMVVGAVYVFSTMNFKFHVSEPFTAMYYVVPSGSLDVCNTYDEGLFSEVTDSVINLESIYGDMYPGEYHKICLLITNDKDEPISFSSEFTSDDLDMLSFHDLIWDSTFVPAEGETYGLFDFIIAGDAEGLFEGKIEFAR